MTDDPYKTAKRIILTALYNMILAHESRGLDTIDINWMRDYIDDMAVGFPDQAPEVDNK